MLVLKILGCLLHCEKKEITGINWTYKVCTKQNRNFYPELTATVSVTILIIYNNYLHEY